MVETRLTTVVVSGRYGEDKTVYWDLEEEVLGPTLVPAVVEEA
jgi:hypothetical protein